MQLRTEIPWLAAQTPTYVFVSKQLEVCQGSGLSAILCDMPNIGKTFTAKAYVKQHKHAVYVDCSQVKTKLKLIRYIAKEFGVTSNGRYSDVYEDLVAYLRTIDTPLVILDEAGDLQYEAFLELKALWNATERCCAWYMMGADGLKEKINRAIEGKKVGYTEMLSRYGDSYSKVTPDDAQEREKFLKAQAAIVAKSMPRTVPTLPRLFIAPEAACGAYIPKSKIKEDAGMISKIEMQAMDAVIGIHREMRKANEIDWEQRRYEIAKSMLPVVRSNSSGIMSIKQVARLAVDYADALIEELKGGNRETEESLQSR